jgi:hypothetical protein
MRLGSHREQLESALRGILGEGMQAALLLFVKFTPSIYILHAVPQRVVHQAGWAGGHGFDGDGRAPPA